MTTPDLFQALRLGPLHLKNRIVLAPMTRSRSKGQVIGELAPTYYAQRASGGLLITEASQVSPQGVGYIDTPGIYNAEQVAAWRKVTDAVHAKGGLIFLQLWHVGRVSHPDFHGGALPVAPSAVGFEGEAYTPQGRKKTVTPRALVRAEIDGIVEDFRRGAAHAKAAGFDGVEIHGANGYLPHQFLEDGANQRSDEYGGSVENRAKFLLAVTRAAIDVWGKERVGVRVSPENKFNGMHDSNPLATYEYAIKELGKLGIAYLHIVGDRDGKYARMFPGTVIANGGFTKEAATARLLQGDAQLVAFGVPYLANPDLPERFKIGAALNAPDPATFYGGDAKGYTDYPALGA